MFLTHEEGSSSSEIDGSGEIDGSLWSKSGGSARAWVVVVVGVVRLECRQSIPSHSHHPRQPTYHDCYKQSWQVCGCG